jgi:hypothetical protein
MTLFAEIEREVSHLEPTLQRNDPSWMSMCLILALATMDRPSGQSPESFLAGVSGYAPDFVGQTVANLDAGGALNDGDLYESLCKMLVGKASGIALGMIANIAVGHMRYFANSATFQITKAGERYVESMPHATKRARPS